MHLKMAIFSRFQCIELVKISYHEQIAMQLITSNWGSAEFDGILNFSISVSTLNELT